MAKTDETKARASTREDAARELVECSRLNEDLLDALHDARADRSRVHLTRGHHARRVRDAHPARDGAAVSGGRKVLVYVAGSSKEIDRAERVIAALRANFGVHVTHDWTVPMRANVCDAELDDAILLPALRADIFCGVRAADHILLLAPREAATKSEGMHVELGAAVEGGLTIHTSGDLTVRPWLRAFVRHAYADDVLAVEALARRVDW